MSIRVLRLTRPIAFDGFEPPVTTLVTPTDVPTYSPTDVFGVKATMQWKTHNRIMLQHERGQIDIGCDYDHCWYEFIDGRTLKSMNGVSRLAAIIGATPVQIVQIIKETRDAYYPSVEFHGVPLTAPSFQMFLQNKCNVCCDEFTARAILWLLDAFVWTRLVHDGDHAIGTRVLGFLLN